MMPVWDLAVRILHWALVLTVAVAWLTRHSPGRWHEWIGYATLAIVAVRAVWGFIGSRYARFADFVRPVSMTAAYARDVLARREARFIGHNPLGGWMVVALLAMVALVGLDGLALHDRPLLGRRLGRGASLHAFGHPVRLRRPALLGDRVHVGEAPRKPACGHAARPEAREFSPGMK